MRRALLAGSLLLAACTSYFFAWDSSTGQVVVGFVGDNGAIGIVVDAPDTVFAGSAFDVTVNSTGRSDCTRPLRLDVAISGNVARLTPYDSIPPEGHACSGDWRTYPHEGSVTFPTRGTATLEVVGRTSAGDTLLQRSVVVR